MTFDEQLQKAQYQQALTTLAVSVLEIDQVRRRINLILMAGAGEEHYSVLSLRGKLFDLQKEIDKVRETIDAAYQEKMYYAIIQALAGVQEYIIYEQEQRLDTNGTNRTTETE